MPLKDKFKDWGGTVGRRFGVGKEKSSPVQNEFTYIPGVEFSSKMDPWWWLVAVVFIVIILLVVLQPDPYKDLLFFLRDGIFITILLTVVSFILMMILGLIGGLGRISTNPVIRFISTIYVELVRGIPLLVQLIWWYFAAPVVIQTIGRLLHISALAEYQSSAIFLAIFGLVFCYGAYMSEIIRAGIQSIHKGQMEAARSLGMTYVQSMRHIILPQAFKVVLPPVGNEFIMLLKDTSLVSVVAVADITRRGREFMATNFNPLEVWTFIALLYLIMTLFAARLIAWLEKRKRY